jgi:hypothetical protein
MMEEDQGRNFPLHAPDIQPFRAEIPFLWLSDEQEVDIRNLLPRNSFKTIELQWPSTDIFQPGTPFNPENIV